MKSPIKKKHKSSYSRLKTRYEILEEKFKKQEKLLHRYRNYNEGLKVDLEERINRVTELRKELQGLQSSFETTVEALRASTELRQDYRFAINQMVAALKESNFCNRKRKIADVISIAERIL